MQLSANPALVRLNGYKSEAEMLNAVQDISSEWYVDPDRREQFKQVLFTHGKVTNFVSEVYRHKTRERIWISENARLVCDLRNPLLPRTTRVLFARSPRKSGIAMPSSRLFKLSENLPGGLFQLSMSPRRQIQCALSQQFVYPPGGTRY